jgi:hypothetical protein
MRAADGYTNFAPEKNEPAAGEILADGLFDGRRPTRVPRTQSRMKGPASMIHCNSSERTDSSTRSPLRVISNESRLNATGGRDSLERMDSSIRPEGELSEFDRFS